MTWVKICGITDEGGLEAALSAGADAVGFVFYPKSSRALEPAAAGRLARRAEGLASRVGVLVDPSEERLGEILDEVPLDILQWSGAEVPPFARGAGRGKPILRAVHLAHGDAWPKALPDAWGYLADARMEGSFGGTGRLAPWGEVARAARRLRVVLAGGLDPQNVAGAVAAVRPFGVDVSSGVETGGRKDPQKIRQFVEAVRGVADGGRSREGAGSEGAAESEGA